MSKSLKFKIENSRKGFTLIEMLIVVSVVGIGIVGALSFFSISLANQFEVKQELIAAGLAQEGTELVRNIRDYNVLNGLDWRNGYGPSFRACKTIDYNSLFDHQCLAAANLTAVCVDPTGRYYQCASGTSGITDFTRTVDISNEADGSIKVVCTVSWNGRATQSVVYLYENSF